VLEKIKGNTFLVRSYSNIGVFVNERTVYIIDTGSNESLAVKLGKYLLENFPRCDFIVMHTHDHTKGNAKIKDRLNAQFFAAIEEIPLGIHPEFEGIYLFGSPAPKFLRGSFFVSKGVEMQPLKYLESPIATSKFPGHSPGHTIFKTPDKIVFTGDLVFEERIMEKYKYLYIMDIEKHLESLKKARNLDGELFIPSHGEVMSKEVFQESIDRNSEFVKKQLENFLDILESPLNIDEITGRFLVKIGFKGNEGLYFLARSFVSAVVKYFYDKNMLVTELTSKGLTFKFKN